MGSGEETLGRKDLPSVAASRRGRDVLRFGVLVSVVAALLTMTSKVLAEPEIHLTLRIVVRSHC